MKKNDKEINISKLLLLSKLDSNRKVIATPKKVKNHMKAIFTKCKITTN